MSENVHGSYVSYKVSKIRWKPEDLEEPEVFVTGSVDEEENKISLWYYPVDGNDVEIYPKNETSRIHAGDVTEIKFLTKNSFVVSSSNGSVKLLQCTRNELSELASWDGLHYFKTGEISSCSSLTCFEEDIATVGEDGRIVLLTVSKSKPVRIIDQADSCPLTCISFLMHHELVTGNHRGQMKLWDLKCPEDTPMSTFMLSSEHIGATCVTHHPTQKHLMLAGAEDGFISVWDLRKSTYPVNSLNAHKNSVSEIVFHPERPEHLFSCSHNGELWHWNTSKSFKDIGGDEASWLISDAAKHRMEIFSLMANIRTPVNSLDVTRSRLICGCDNEAVFIIKNLVL